MKCPLLPRVLVLLAASTLLVDCIPYSVGSTARTVLPGETRYAFSTYVLPRDLGLQPIEYGFKPGFDVEARRGLTQNSDIGLRVVGVDGAVVTYKRRLDGSSAKAGAGIAAMIGGGFITTVPHGELEATLIASADESAGNFTPYGGLRGVYTKPLTSGVTQKPVTYGGFGGMHIGPPNAGVSFEVGVFKDNSGLRESTKQIAIVPSVTVTGDFLARMMGILTGRNR